MLEHGYRRVALITNAPLEFVSARERTGGYRRAMAAAGLDPDERVVEGGKDAASG